MGSRSLRETENEVLRMCDQAFLPLDDQVVLGHLMLSRMFAKRLRGYRSLGYAQSEAPVGFGEIDDDFILGRDWAETDAGEDEPV
jgi:hypothetical protein